MRRTPLQALASSPTMVGAITTLIVIVAVFLAYNANNGLPFVPTYRVNVDIPNAARLIRNNEVRIGGNRVGVVESISAISREDAGGSAGADTPIEGPAEEGAEEGDSGAVLDTDTSVDPPGDVVARLTLKLDENVGPLPQDSIFRVRYKSAFGLKYLDITRGDGPGAEEGFTFNGTNDVDAAGDDDQQILSFDEAAENPEAADGTFIDQTEFDDIGNTFDQRTRNAGRQNLLGYGNALAGRGGSLNLAIESLNPLLTNLRPVARVLARKSTRLRRLFPELGDAARIIAPVATEQADLFTNMAIAFGAISADPEALAESIQEGPPTLETGIRTLPAQQVFLAEFTDLTERLNPGIRQLRLALPDLNSAVENGTPVLRRTPRMYRDLRTVFKQTERLVDQPTTLTTLKRLKQTFNKGDELAEFVVPAQTVCNYWNYWFTFFPEHLSERDSSGLTQRVSLIATPSGPLTISSGGVPLSVPGEVETGLSIGGYSGLQANGKEGPVPNPLDEGFFDPREFPILHGNPTQPAGQDGSDCQSGQTGYLLGGNFGVPGQPKSNPAVGKPNLPGDRGPTTVFFKRNGTRTLKDTRVDSRQPE
jgi:ABC-type transporter Mla subunit MlaD